MNIHLQQYLNGELEVITNDEYFNNLKANNNLFTKISDECVNITLKDLVKIENTEEILFMFFSTPKEIFGKSIFHCPYNERYTNQIEFTNTCEIAKIKETFGKIENLVKAQGFDDYESFINRYKQILKVSPEYFV